MNGEILVYLKNRALEDSTVLFGNWSFNLATLTKKRYSMESTKLRQMTGRKRLAYI